MKERPFEFGPKRNLVGILTTAAEKDIRPNAPAVLMLNAGLLHRVGPHGMSVKLARRLAASGVSSLRFDIGGFGDSDSLMDANGDEARAWMDVKEAMNFLESKFNCHSFVLFGLCAGADNSHAVALQDQRVVGAIMLDGFGYWTWKSYVRHYLPRMVRAGVWLNFFRRKLVSSRLAAKKSDSLSSLFRRSFGPRKQVEGEIQALVDRGTQLLFFYTGGVFDYYNYENQFFDMFSSLNARGNVDVQYYPNCDHTYVFAEDRERMFARIVEWYCSRNWNAN